MTIVVSKVVYDRAGLTGKALEFMPETVAELQDLLSKKQHAVRVLADLEMQAKATRHTANALPAKKFARIKANLKTKRAQVQEITMALAEAKKQDRIARRNTLSELFMEVVRASARQGDFENWLGEAVKKLPEHMKEFKQ